MAIPKAQLETWSRIGAQQTSKDTHTNIRAIIDSPDSPHYQRQPSTFLQGSYRNDTNIWAESDVDIVAKVQSIYYYDISALSAIDQEDFRRKSPPTEYTLQKFKVEVIAWLQKHYGTDLELSSNKAVTIAARGNRRKADILISSTFRRYHYAGFMGAQAAEGIMFVTNEGKWIENYPVYHSNNLTARHQETDNWLKPAIRIFKNMRNEARDQGILPEGIAPSYFVEGLLYNVPVHVFGQSYFETVRQTLIWLLQADRNAFICANGQHQLVASNSPVSWHPDHCRDFLAGLVNLWDSWR